ncbi:squalene/phytoene synthase family protein [Paenirhodobacter populi]|uniref:Phytoene synthase n=1 Tax=Paenirhodobacter populi TaxID=2306993 RepID=A0A443JU37_9RHOB|nr:squalene/phytoene synthase family protein [Sinirhodobacter populi]RWR24011.1 phytoene synthase [Sinirhodobacter populi]
MTDLAASMAAAADLVAAGDPDRFAATMATPAELRGRLWPLYAVNLEIARAPWASAEPLVAEMRLQWWVDALSELAEEGRAPDHILGPALAAQPPLAEALLTVAEARRRDCWAEGFADTAEVWDYLAATSGQVYRAAAVALGAAPAELDLLSEFGTAAGLAAWLTAVPEMARRGRPALHPDEATDLAADGWHRLGRARTGLRRASHAARLAALPGWQARAILMRARKTPHRVFDGTLGGSEFSRRFSLLVAAFRL